MLEVLINALLPTGASHDYAMHAKMICETVSPGTWPVYC